MNEKFTSLDSIVEDIKAECEARVVLAERRADLAEIESRLSAERERRATDDKDYAQMVASRLMAYFEVAEGALAKAKEFALTIPQAETKTEVPMNRMESTDEQAKEADA